MDFPDPYASLRDRKLVVLGIPFDVETEELKYYMMKFGELEDCIVMKDRTTGQSRGFGFVTFMTAEDAKKACAAHHVLSGRVLDVKVATPKDEMTQSTARKGGRIFVARIPPSVTEGMFRSYFQKYGVIVDAYMPKDVGSRMHRGIGFVTFESAESVDKIMSEPHELGGSTVAVDRATPKEDTPKYWGSRQFADQSNKPFNDQWTKDFCEQWSKMTPDQWGKCFPEQWSKGFPDQFSFFMAAAAAALNGMEGFDFSGYGFPTAAGNEKSENAWNASNTEGAKDARVPVSESAGTGRAPIASPSAAGYAPLSNAPESNTADGSTSGTASETAQNPSAPGYGPLLSGSNMPSAPNSDPNYHMYSATCSDPGYGSSAQPTTSAVPSSNYFSNTGYSSFPTSDRSGTGYSRETNYNSAPAVGNYSSGGYYGMMPPYHNSMVGASSYSYSSGSASSNPSSAASYPSSSYGPSGSYGPAGGYGPSAGYGYGPSASYSGMATNPYSGSRYSSSNPYASSTPPIPEHSSQPSYANSNTITGGGFGSSEHYNEPPAGYKTSGLPIPTMRNKVFIGKLPHDATAEHLRTYFSSFGRILDVYVPKDAKKTGHRGFGFVTFFDDGVAERVSKESHEILGQTVAVDRPTPQENTQNSMSSGSGSHSSTTHRTGYGNLDYFSSGLASYGGGRLGSGRMPRSDSRYRPY